MPASQLHLEYLLTVQSIELMLRDHRERHARQRISDIESAVRGYEARE